MYAESKKSRRIFFPWTRRLVWTFCATLHVQCTAWARPPIQMYAIAGQSWRRSGANQRDWSSSRSRNGDCTPVCSRWPSQLWSSNGGISRELRAAWQRQTVNGDAYISNDTRRAPKQAPRLRFCEELCPGKQQHDGEMTETQSTRTGRKTRCHPGKHPGILYIVTRDRGGRDDVMRKSPTAKQQLPAALRSSGHESSADWLTAKEPRDKNVAAACMCLFYPLRFYPHFYSLFCSFYSSLLLLLYLLSCLFS